MQVKPVVLCIEPFTPSVLELIRRELGDAFAFRTERALPPQPDPSVEYLLTMSTPVGQDWMERLPSLRLVQKLGAGSDRIDLEAARQRGIRVAITRAQNAISVAEHAILLMLAVLRNLLALDRDLRQGRWAKWEYRERSFELFGKRVGIVGFGAIGRAVAERLKGFGTQLAAYDVVKVDESLGVRQLGLRELFSFAEIVTIHLPLTPETRGLIGRDLLSLLPPHGVLVNTARGGIVDEQALESLLREGRLAGAGLDVFSVEPPSPDHPLLKLPNVVATPHVGGGTWDSMRRVVQRGVANIHRTAQGLGPFPEDVVV